MQVESGCGASVETPGLLHKKGGGQWGEGGEGQYEGRVNLCIYIYKMKEGRRRKKDEGRKMKKGRNM